MILERNIEELEMDIITDCLCIDGLDSCINAGADELRVGGSFYALPNISRHIWSRPIARGWILGTSSAPTIF